MELTPAFREGLRALWSDDPLLDVYNVDGLTDVVLTADIDWAPDFAIEQMFDAVGERGHKMTAFATHPSPVLESAPEHIEVALHPDFTRPQGAVPFHERLLRLKDWYPGAVGTRSHRNFFGQNVVDMAHACGLIYDASTVLWNEPFCQAHVGVRGVVRFSYMWEDGLHLDMHPELSWEGIRLDAPGLKVINVHPMLLYLNSRTEEHRRGVTSRYTDLTVARREEIDPLVHRERGIRDLWVELLDRLSREGVRTHHLSELARSVLASHERGCDPWDGEAQGAVADRGRR